MNKRFFSKFRFAVAVISTVGTLSSHQVSAACNQYHDSPSCLGAPEKCWWVPSGGECNGEYKACTSQRALHNIKTCLRIHGCYWDTSNSPGMCVPPHSQQKKQ